MPRWIRCPGCDGEVGVPDDWTEPVVTCLNCAAKVAVKPESTVQWRPSQHGGGDSGISDARPEVGTGAPPGPQPETQPTIPIGRAKTAPNWFLPAGLVSLSVAAGSSLACALYGGGGTLEGALVAVALNPLLWVSGPLAWYWLVQWNKYSGGNKFSCPHCGARRGVWTHFGFVGQFPYIVQICCACKKRLRTP